MNAVWGRRQHGVPTVWKNTTAFPLSSGLYYEHYIYIWNYWNYAFFKCHRTPPELNLQGAPCPFIWLGPISLLTATLTLGDSAFVKGRNSRVSGLVREKLFYWGFSGTEPCSGVVIWSQGASHWCYSSVNLVKSLTLTEPPHQHNRNEKSILPRHCKQMLVAGVFK